MYFSSVLDHCTLMYPESHAFSHRSYSNSLLDCLSACVAFLWPISSKQFFTEVFVLIAHSSWLISHLDHSIVQVNCFSLPPPHFFCMVTTLPHFFT